VDQPSPGPAEVTDAVNAASEKLNSLLQLNPYPELQNSLNRLATAFEDVRKEGSPEAAPPRLADLEKGIQSLYRTSIAQTNATPQKYQQPIFQCYSDYEVCISEQQSPSGRIICMSLFVLSIADNLVSISIK
jgi:hypothetical protein